MDDKSNFALGLWRTQIWRFRARSDPGLASGSDLGHQNDRVGATSESRDRSDTLILGSIGPNARTKAGTRIGPYWCTDMATAK